MNDPLRSVEPRSARANPSTTPETLTAAHVEAAFRRGYHQGLSRAAEKVQRAPSLGFARGLLRGLEDAAQAWREGRGDQP